jgi:hypothetical protein
MAWHTVGRGLYRIWFVLTLAWLLIVVGHAVFEHEFWQLLATRAGPMLGALALLAAGPPAVLLALGALLWRLTARLRHPLG